MAKTPLNRKPEVHSAMPKVLQVDVSVCKRCGGSHEQVEFRQFELGDPESTHWGYCPASAEPLLIDMRRNAPANSKFIINWMDAPKGAAVASANRKYPEGRDVEPKAIPTNAKTCKLELVYPAPGIGFWKVTCSECQLRATAQAGGQADDPRSLLMLCRNSNPQYDLPEISRESGCQHPNPSGSGDKCQGTAEKLSLMPVGIRCDICAGMHHFDGTPKTDKSVRLCVMGCCGKTVLPADACSKCGGKLKQGLAILPEYGGTPEWPGDTIMTVSRVPSKQPPQECLKCEECGHSYKPGEK